MKFIEHLDIYLAIGVLSLPLYAALAKIFWGEKYETFGRTLKYLIWPDLLSLIQGKFWDDWLETLKFNTYLVLCLGWPAAITEILARHVF